MADLGTITRLNLNAIHDVRALTALHSIVWVLTDSCSEHHARLEAAPISPGNWATFYIFFVVRVREML